jgi:hypothetical protein
LPGLPSGLKFLEVPSKIELSNYTDVLPALRLFSASSESVQAVRQTDHGREFRHVGEKNVLKDTDWLMEFDCEEVEFLY